MQGWGGENTESIARREVVRAESGEDGNSGRNDKYKTEKSKVEMPCFSVICRLT